MQQAKISLDEVNRITSSEKFNQLFHALFEHSPWVAEGAWILWKNSGDSEKTFHHLKHLHQVFCSAMYFGSYEQKLALICAHPSLGDKARIKTDESRKEQHGAGLDSLSQQEYDELLSLNKEYRDKFGFPFILAVKGHNKNSIIENMRMRVVNPKELEFDEALEQISKIALFRLQDIVEDRLFLKSGL